MVIEASTYDSPIFATQIAKLLVTTPNFQRDNPFTTFDTQPIHKFRHATGQICEWTLLFGLITQVCILWLH